MRGVGWGLVVATLLCDQTARAQSDDTAMALSLFEEGKRLSTAGDYQAGCPKLLASYQLVQKLGTLLNLADCYEKQGKTASAWARFTEAATMAARASQSDRVEFAKTHAAALVPKLVRLTITAESTTDVRADGVVVASAALGTAVPVDPGPHVIDASAPGRKPWSETIQVDADTTVAIPVLEVLPIVAPPAAVEAPAQPPRPSDSSTQRTVGMVGIGVGAAGIAASVIFGGFASNAYAKSNGDGNCDTSSNFCTSSGLERRSDAKTLAGIATGAFVGGVVLLAGGLTVFFTAPRAQVSIGPGSVDFRRAF